MSEIQPGRETDARVAEVVFGIDLSEKADHEWRRDENDEVDRYAWQSDEGYGPVCDRCGAMPFGWETDTGRCKPTPRQVSTDDGAAWGSLWPKIVERAKAKWGERVAVLSVSHSMEDDTFSVERWSIWEEAVIADAPTLALCLTRAALALYGEGP